MILFPTLLAICFPRKNFAWKMPKRNFKGYETKWMFCCCPGSKTQRLKQLFFLLYTKKPHVMDLRLPKKNRVMTAVWRIWIWSYHLVQRMPDCIVLTFLHSAMVSLFNGTREGGHRPTSKCYLCPHRATDSLFSVKNEHSINRATP